MVAKRIEKEVIEKLKAIFDPEIPVNIYDLGLIYNIELKESAEGFIGFVTMTLTSAACPVSESLVDQVRNVGYLVEGLEKVEVELVFEPPWTQDSMSDEARLQLGMM